MKYVCDVCGYVYDPAVGDPENGVAPGTPWEEVPEDWLCRCARSVRTSSARKRKSLRQERTHVFSCRFFRFVEIAYLHGQRAL